MISKINQLKCTLTNEMNNLDMKAINQIQAVKYPADSNKTTDSGDCPANTKSLHFGKYDLFMCIKLFGY